MTKTQITDHDALFSELSVELDAKTRELEALNCVPDGPWEALKVSKDEMLRNSIIMYDWKVWNLEYPASTFFGPRKLCIVVRDALNRAVAPTEGEKKG